MNKHLYDLRIKDISISEYNVVTIFLTNNSKFTANLSSDFSKLFCYPKNLIEWKSVRINEGAFALEWDSGFDIHFDQIIAIADNQKQTA